MCPIPAPIPDRSDGQTIDETWFDILKTDIEDLDTRVGVNEDQVRVMEFTFNGFVGDLPMPIVGAMLQVIDDSYDLLSVVAFLLQAGSSGNFVPVLEVSSDSGASWNSVCTSDPTIPFTDGNYAEQAGVINSGFDQVNPGDLLRVSLTSVQPGQYYGTLRVKYTLTAIP